MDDLDYGSDDGCVVISCHLLLLPCRHPVQVEEYLSPAAPVFSTSRVTCVPGTPSTLP